MRLVKIVAGFLAAVMLTLSVMSGVGFGDLVSAGGEIDPETGLMFTLLENGTYSVSCPSETQETLAGDILIPATFKNKPVTELGAYCFKQCGNITSVSIPEGVRKIGGCAFWQCRSLKRVYIPASVVVLDKGLDDVYMFALCPSLTEISVADENPEFCSVDGVLLTKDQTVLWTYPAGKLEENYIIPDTVETIELDSFFGCANLKSVTMGENVQTIRYAFKFCNNLETINISAGVNNIVGRFTECTALKNINVSEDNNTYCSENGILFSKDKTSLMLYPAGKNEKTYDIPESVSTIESCAFQKCVYLESIIISDNVTNIGVYAFDNCESLKDVHIPARVSEIGKNAFGDCHKLMSITVDEENALYCAVDGVLFSKNMDELLVYPESKKDTIYAVPDGVKKMSRIDNGVLEKLMYPHSLEELPYISHKLDIEYDGTIEEWNVLIDNSIDYIQRFYADCAVFCVDGVIGVMRPEKSHIPEKEPITEIRDDGIIEFSAGISKETADRINNLDEGRIEEYKTVLQNITAETSSESGFDTNTSLYVDPKDTVPSEFKTAVALDLIFKNASGDVVQPEKPVLVRIPVPERLKDKDPIFVYHIGDDGKIEKVEVATEIIDGVRCTVFETDCFSVYVLTGEMVETDGGDVDDANTTTEELLELLSFTLQSDGTYFATCPVENKDKLVGDIVFPSKYNDIPITAIELSELSGECNNITSVTVPEGVCHFVIDRCENLKAVNLPSTIEFISSNTILGCPGLIEVNVSEDSLKYCSEDGIVFSKDKTALILFPAGKNKDVYEIPESVTEIESRAFGFNQNVRVISIHAGVTKISDDLAEYSERLEAIMVDVDNGAFCSVDGVLFSKDMTRLLEYPPAKADKDYTVPDGILQIHEISNNNLTALVVPDGVSDIGSIKCTNLAKVTLPKSLEKYPCIYVSVKNTEIVYGGTVAEWNDLVENASEYMKKRYADFIIRCSDSNTGGDTSEPDTSDPDTSDPDGGNTSKPDTSEPGTGDTSGDNSGDTSVPTSPVIPSIPDTNGGFSANSNISAGAPGVHISNSLSEFIDALMSTEEKEQYKNGANVNVILEVKDISGQVPSSDVRVVEAALGNLSGYRVGKYLDLTLLKTIGKTEKTVIISRNPITIVIDIPQDLLGYGREYAVIRVHSGEVSVLNDKDSNDETVTIDTDSFSTYVLIYKEQLSPAESVSSNGDTFSDGGLIGDNTSSVGDTTTSLPTNEEDEKIPYTGIQSYTMVYLTAGLVSLLVFLLLCFFTGKNGMTEAEKNKAFSKLIAWGKSGGRVRSVIALAAIFFVLIFYYGIGMKTSER